MTLTGHCVAGLFRPACYFSASMPEGGAMRRRELLRAVAGLAVAWPSVARAQPSAKVKRLGVLMSVRENDPEGKTQLSAFMEALAVLGWVVDRNLSTDVRWGGGDVDRTRTFAKELVALHPDVILTQGTPGTAALQPETRTIPIVFVVVADPVGPGFVASLSRPGGNITGFINSEATIGVKMLELLSEISSEIKRVAMIFNPDTAPGHGTYYYRDFEAAARSSQIEPIEAHARTDIEIEAIVTALAEEPRGGLIVTPDYFMFNHTQQIVSHTARRKVPTIYPWKSVVSRQDGLLSYGPDLVDIVRRSAVYVDKIFRGEKPADLPVQIPIKFEVAVNVRTARAQRLTVPTSIMVRADEVIE